MIWAVLATLVLVFAVIIAWILLSPTKFTKGIKLEKSFVSLGNMQGMSKDYIISKVGQPNTISQIDDSQILHWRELGYSIVIYFDSQGKFSDIIWQSDKCQ